MSFVDSELVDGKWLGPGWGGSVGWMSIMHRKVAGLILSQAHARIVHSVPGVEYAGGSDQYSNLTKMFFFLSSCSFLSL